MYVYNTLYKYIVTIIYACTVYYIILNTYDNIFKINKYFYNYFKGFIRTTMKYF